MISLKDIDLQNITPERLGELLIEAKKAYYTSAKPIMDDHTYDTLENILREKNPHHRLFQKVGHPNFDTGFSKASHSMPMGSQNKVSTYEQMVHYFELKKLPPNTEFIVQPKCDGISLETRYRQGRLVDAITRGDGHIGDVVTQNVIKMKNFSETLNQDFTGSIRCEIVVTYKDFQKLNQISDESYSNPRNAASGLTQRLDGKFAQYCTLLGVDLYPYPDTEMSKISLINSLGLVAVDTFLCPDFAAIESTYQQFLAKRQKYDFDIDGLVIKVNRTNLQQLLGSRDNRPKGQVAYKFPALTNQTRITTITWQVGPLGMITPVAQVEPIQISGAIVAFASLANFTLVQKMQINVGDIVQISRRGDVIPHIETVVSKTYPDSAPIPQNCPACHTPLVVDHKVLRCPNSKDCLPQILGSLRLFCDTLNIKGISDKTIEKLYAANRLRLPGDFYRLTVDDFVDLNGLGQKSGTNIVHQIQSKRKLTVKQILDAAVIPNFSAARIQQLIAAGYNTIEKIIALTPNQLEPLPGFKSTLAQKICQGIRLRQTHIQSIASQVEIIQTSPSSKKFANLTFAITGTLSQPRQQIASQIEANGGKIVSSVSAATTYLVTNNPNSGSSKFKNAQKFNVKIINEAQLAQLTNDL